MRGISLTEPVPVAPRSKTRVLLRLLAVVVVIVVALFCVGAVVAATNNTTYPTCADVVAGKAQLSAHGLCYKGSSFQQYATLVFAYAGGVAIAFSGLLSLVLLVTGRRCPLSAKLV